DLNMTEVGDEAVAAEAVADDDLLTAIRVAGEPLDELPEDLYIPPDALRVILEAFEGPLDLLLYLIRRQNFDILDIPVHKIATQYVAYIELMQEMEIELAGEYLLMATMLAEIKSRMLLPRPAAEAEEGEDPRAELVRRLQEYERFREAAEHLGDWPRVGRDLVAVQQRPEQLAVDTPMPETDIRKLLLAFRDVLQRAELFTQHQIEREPLSVRQTMSDILQKLQPRQPVAFVALFDPQAGRSGVVVCFLAILELAREALIEIAQESPATPLAVALAGAGSRLSPEVVHD